MSTEGGDSCPACLATARVRVEFDSYRLFGCSRCGCWSSDALVRGAATSFEPENYFRNAECDRDKWAELWRRLERAPGDMGAALDVGCGTGAYLRYLRGLSPSMRLEGIEVEVARAEEARVRNPSARIHAGDATNSLAATGGNFDLITLWDVFEHVSDPRQLLAKLAAQLSSDGVIYVQTINERSLVPWLGRVAYGLTGGRLEYPVRRSHEAHHLVFFTTEGLEGIAAAARLRIRDRWFDRLARERMDGHPLVTQATSLLLALENRVGGGLFVNLVLERDR